MIVTMEMYEQIRKFSNQGKSIHWIAKKLGVSRQTVRKYRDGKTLPNTRKEYHRESTVITQEIKNFINSCIEADNEENLRKQKHTAKRIFDRLVEEKGFAGGESTIRKFVQETKADNISRKADIPLFYAPGDAVQIDWGEATVYIDGIKTQINIFCARLCYSCDSYVQAFYKQNMESFLEAIQGSLEFFEGVPNRVIFDNAKVAVKEGFGKHAKTTDNYRLFAAHYAFIPEFCNVASGNEKGLVENLVGYSRRNFLVPVPRINSIEELNEHLAQKCLDYRANHSVDSHSRSVKEEYQEEKAYLQNLPVLKYDTSKTEILNVNDYSLVRFGKNNYSVPHKYIGKHVTAKAYANKILICSSNEVIAVHKRLYSTKRTSYRLEHYIDQIERKPRCVFQAKPVLETISQEFLEWGKKLPGGNYEMVKLLRLCIDYGEDHILELKHSLPPEAVPTVETIRGLLHMRPQPEALAFPRDVEVIVTDLRIFDEKCGVTSI